MRSAVSSSVHDLWGDGRGLLLILWLTLHLTEAFLSWSLRICCLSQSLRILAFNCKIGLAFEALEALITVKMLPISRPVQQIVCPHRDFIASCCQLFATHSWFYAVTICWISCPWYKLSKLRYLRNKRSFLAWICLGTRVVNQATESSSSAMLGGIPSQDFSSQGFAFVDRRVWISNKFFCGPGIFITR